MINWKVRIKNKLFWTSIIPMVIVLITEVAKLFGYNMNIAYIGEQLVSIVETVFIILGIIGIVNDPTTEGITDSDLAMTYEVPKEKAND